jgi:hypothetical protein
VCVGARRVLIYSFQAGLFIINICAKKMIARLKTVVSTVFKNDNFVEHSLSKLRVYALFCSLYYAPVFIYTIHACAYLLVILAAAQFFVETGVCSMGIGFKLLSAISILGLARVAREKTTKAYYMLSFIDCNTKHKST